MSICALPLRFRSTGQSNTYAGKTSRMVSVLVVTASLLAACGGDNDNTALEPDSDLDANAAVMQRFGALSERDSNPQIDTQIQSRVIGSFNDLSLQLLREQGDSDPGENTINSGFSLAVAMSMLQRATANGDFDLIQQILGVSDIGEEALYSAINAIDLDLESRSNDGLELRSANQLFVKPGFAMETDFLDSMTGQFDAPISDAQFETQPEQVLLSINEWASENTNNLIPTLLSQPLPANTVLTLLNATLLDAKWRQEFDDYSNLEFTTSDGSVQSVAGFSGVYDYRFLETEDALSVSIPYTGSEISLMIIVPEDIETYTANLTAATVSDRHDSAQSAYLALRVPNWATDSSINFTTLPMTNSLAGRTLNMTRMTSDPECCEVTQFKQAATIEVDKDGTRAAAVTGISVGTTSVRPEPQIVNIDRPFVFLIRDEPTGLILFSGRVLSL